jgi:hypothetical protein
MISEKTNRTQNTSAFSCWSANEAQGRSVDMFGEIIPDDPKNVVAVDCMRVHCVRIVGMF